MTRPTDHQADERLNQLQAELTLLPETRARLLAALKRDRAGTTTADGYGAGRSANIGGPATVLHCFTHQQDNCPCGHNIPITVASDPTGDAAASRDQAERDEVRNHLEHAWGYLEQAAHSLAALRGRLALIEELADPNTRTDPAGTCNRCGRHVEGTAVDRLRSGYCFADYRAWLRAGRPDRAAFERTRAADPGPDAAA